MAGKSLDTKVQNGLAGLADRVAKAGGVTKVAARAGVDKGYVSHICAGNRNPSLDVMRSLAAALGTSIAVVVGEIEEVRRTRAPG